MYPNPCNDRCHQTFTQFKSGLPLLPLLSPLILGYPHTPDLVQRHQQLEYRGTDHIIYSNLQGDPSSDTPTQKYFDGTLNLSDTESKDENYAIDSLRLELETENSKNPCGEHSTSSFSTCSESNSAVIHLPPVHDVGAFHAHAHIVEELAPAMQRGSSHRVEIMGPAKNGDSLISPSSIPVIDLDLLSFSPLFSSQHDNPLLSPSWNLELTLSSSWHLAAESAIFLSQPAAQGSRLIRRPATRRKGLADSSSPKLPIRKSPYMSARRTLFDLNQKRSPVECGILRAMNSPVLKSRGYRVRFEAVEAR